MRELGTNNHDTDIIDGSSVKLLIYHSTFHARSSNIGPVYIFFTGLK
jgi:hypothetical protein